MPGPAQDVLTPSEVLARLERSERGLRQLVDNASHPTCLVGHDGVIVRANPAVEALLGYAPAEAEGMHVEVLISPTSRSAHRTRREALSAAPPTGPVGTVRITALHRDGREIPIEIGLSGVETADGPVMCATLRDISADLRREREDAALSRIAAIADPQVPLASLLASVVEEAAALLDAEKSVIGRFDPDGAVVVVGLYGDHLTAVGDVIPPESGSTLITVRRTGAAERLAYDDLPADDPIRALATALDHHHAVAVPISVHTRLWGGLMVASTQAVPAGAVDALTRFAEFAGAMIGAAESNATERALRDSEERFRLLADFIPQILWTAGADGRCDFLNRGWVAYTGVPVEQGLGLGWIESVHPDDRSALMRKREGAMERDEPFAMEFRLRGHDGAYRRFETRAVGMQGEHGGIVRWFGSNTDVEDARATAETVRASEAQLRAALDAGRMGAWTFDAQGGRLRVDANIRTLFGLGPEIADDDVREALAARVHPDDRERVRDGFAQAVEGTGTSHHSEYRVVLPGGDLRWIESWGRLARDEDGAPGMFTGVMIDVTDARRAGERLLRSQKLEALGTLAGGIAHDFNNLLQVIGGHVAIARAELPPTHGAQEPLGTVERAAQRAADLVGRILTFSRPDDGAVLEPVALAPVVEEALDMLRPTLPAMIELRWSAEDDLVHVNGDPAGITQLVTNLATNAAQAIGRRAGVIEFRAVTATLTAEEVQSAPDLAAGAYVVLTVSDDGPGIDPAILSRIFDPFFTTKGAGEGTGLGLSIVHSLMRAHGGAVTVYSVPGTGTAFNLYFPVPEGGAPTPAGTREAAAVPALPCARAGRILFVDDEPDLVALNERSLVRVGHTVTGHTDPRAALEEFRADPSAFDAVVTDLSMPGITGLELAREVLALRPDIPVLIASGYIPPDERAEAEALGVREMLPKPSPISRLRDALAAALDG